jgi:hypothetical protein
VQAQAKRAKNEPNTTATQLSNGSPTKTAVSNNVRPINLLSLKKIADRVLKHKGSNLNINRQSQSQTTSQKTRQNHTLSNTQYTQNRKKGRKSKLFLSHPSVHEERNVCYGCSSPQNDDALDHQRRSKNPENRRAQRQWHQKCQNNQCLYEPLVMNNPPASTNPRLRFSFPRHSPSALNV